jgi:hypothetical protein
LGGLNVNWGMGLTLKRILTDCEDATAFTWLRIRSNGGILSCSSKRSAFIKSLGVS